MSFCFFCWDPSRTADDLAHKGEDRELDEQDAKILYYSPSYAAQEEIRMQVAMVQGIKDFTKQFDIEEDLAAAFGGAGGSGIFSTTAGPAGDHLLPGGGGSCASSSALNEQIGGSRSSTSSSLKKNTGLKSIKTKEHCMCFEEVEPDIFFALSVRHPVQTKADGTDEYLETVTQESTLSAVLKNLYQVFRLLHGPVRSYVSSSGRKAGSSTASTSAGIKQNIKGKTKANSQNNKNKDVNLLRDLFEDLLPAFLETVSCHLLDSHHGNGIFYHLDGFQYGPVERNTYLTISSYIAKLKENVPFSKAALFYKAHLIHSGIARSDMKVLYSYLVNLFDGSVSNAKLNRPPYARIPTAAAGHHTHSSPFGRSHLVAGEDATGTSTSAGLLGGGVSASASTGTSGARGRNLFGSSGGGRGGASASGGPSGSFLLGADTTSSTNAGSSSLGGGGGASSASSKNNASSSNAGLFVPRIFLEDGSEGQLVALCYRGLLQVLIFDANTVNVDARLLESVRYFSTAEAVMENLSTLIDIIDKQFSLVMSPEDDYKFLYFNHGNQALRVSSHYNAVHKANQSGAAGSASAMAASAAAKLNMKGQGTRARPGEDPGMYPRGNASKEQPQAVGTRVYNLVSGAVASVISSGSEQPVSGGQENEDMDSNLRGPRVTLSQLSNQSTAEYLARGEKELFLTQNLHETIGQESESGYREVCLKEAGRGWICAKRSLEREFFLMLSDPNMMLSKCQEENARFSNIHFQNIYMM
ncbi:unnamed protein product [Amoebophrya sp. A25]|nr:unnamed protein product [Amoebophrya sp. A25]|eukprot:GSA25T00017880001.1